MSVIPLEAERRARELLPWHLNGTLPAPERAEVERMLALSGSLRAESAWLGDLHTQLQEEAAETLPASRPAGAEQASLDAVLALVKGEREGRVMPLRGSAQPGTSRWNRWARPLLAIAAALVLVQAVVIGQLLHGGGGNSLAPAAGGTGAGSGVVLQLVFRETATAREMRGALAAADAEIVGGPGQLGVYMARVSPEKAQAAIVALQRNPAIESVSRVPP